MTQSDSTAHKNDGVRLRLLRCALGLSQKQLAARLGCSDKTVRNHEKAKFPIPRAESRKFAGIAQVDITPLDPNEDPYLTLKQYYEIQGSETVLEVASPKEIKPTLKARILQFRTYNIFRNQYVLTPLRRAYENTISFIYLTATVTFAMEQFQRAIGGWTDHQAYHDALLVISGVLTLFFFATVASNDCLGY